jgi:hypothetical protein
MATLGESEMLDVERRFEVATMSHEPLASPKPRSTLLAVLSITQLWASLSIVVIWLAVLVTAVYGSDIVNRGAGGDFSSIPSVAFVALFAAIATWAVAKYGFRSDR